MDIPLITFVEKKETSLPFDPIVHPPDDTELFHTRGVRWYVANEMYGIWKIAGDDAENVGKLGKVMWQWYLAQRYPLINLYYRVRRCLRDLRLTYTTEAYQLED